MQDLYFKTKQSIDRIDVRKLWNGFLPLKFALYNQDSCCFDGKMIEKPSGFLANTAVEYHGEYIAIWNVADDIAPEILASKIVHEMFHGFQNINNESRFPNELHALYTYRYRDENLSVKLEENRLLVELTQEFCPEKLKRFLSLRKYRSEHFPDEFLYEAKIEQIEGSANYVELNALRQLSDSLYRQKLEKMCTNILKPSNLLPIRIPSYDIGALLLHVLGQNSIPFDTQFSDITFAQALLQNIPSAEAPATVCMQKHIDAYYSDAAQLVQAALKKNELIAEKTVLLGVNVYNALYWNHYIISNFFVMYGSQATPTVCHGDFVIEVSEEGIANKILKL